MDRIAASALKRLVRDNLALQLQESSDSSRVEAAIRSIVSETIRSWGMAVSIEDENLMCQCIVDDFLRYGPLQVLLDDPSITEIMVNGGGIDFEGASLSFRDPKVFVERAGRIEECAYVRFDDAEHVRRIINKIAEQAGVRCDESHAMGCAMLPGGRARATFIIPPLAPDGPALNLRLFSEHIMSMDDLIEKGALSTVMAKFLGAAVRARCPIVISGGTGSGKTTLLGALSGFIPAHERVITIEDTPELRLRAHHVERM